jgi:hypothetical protein
MRRLPIVATVIVLATMSIAAQRRSSEKPSALKTATPEIKCPSLLGMGVKTIRSFCDVPAGRDPALGVLITLPAHVGTGTLSFDLHARHMYSREQTQQGKAYAHYRAVIAVMSMTNDLIERDTVDAEFRSDADLFDRISGGAGPAGLKAIAPVGREQIFVTIPAKIDQVSLVGDSLDALTPAGHETAVMPGRPIAIVSNVLFEYKPAPVRKRR